MQCDYNYLLDIYDKEISKKVQNKNKLYQFEVHKMANITSIYNDIYNIDVLNIKELYFN